MANEQIPVTTQLPGGVSVTHYVRHDLTYYDTLDFRDASGATVHISAPDTTTSQTPNVRMTLDDGRDHIVTGTNLIGSATRVGEAALDIRRQYYIGENMRVTCTRGNQSVYQEASPDDADTLIRQRIQEFARHHPALAQALRQLHWPVDRYKGFYATFGELLDAPAPLRACPAGKPQVVIERLGH